MEGTVLEDILQEGAKMGMAMARWAWLWRRAWQDGHGHGLDPVTHGKCDLCAFGLGGRDGELGRAPMPRCLAHLRPERFRVLRWRARARANAASSSALAALLAHVGEGVVDGRVRPERIRLSARSSMFGAWCCGP